MCNFCELPPLIFRNRETPVGESAPITRASWVACHRHSVGKTELNYKQQDCCSRVNITEVWVGSCTPSSIFFFTPLLLSHHLLYLRLIWLIEHYLNYYLNGKFLLMESFKWLMIDDNGF